MASKLSNKPSNETWRHNLTLHSALSPFTSPIPMTHSGFTDTKPISHKRLNIGGLLVTIYGLLELSSQPTDVTCIWLLHGRGDTQDSMAFVAAAFLHAWAQHRKPGQPALICASIDQRNHGSRFVDPLANESWSAGNNAHAIDMFALFSGTARDVSHLITLLPGYISIRPKQHLVAGISLGGHAAWQLLLSDARVRGGIVVVGSPDYTRLMTDRAVRGGRASTQPPSRGFVGSADFPRALVEAVEQSDPAGVLMGELDSVTAEDHLHTPSKAEQARIRPVMQRTLAGKTVLVLSGGRDKLVPYAQAEPFLTWLKAATGDGGWCADLGVRVEDVVDAEARHEFSGKMREEAERWLCDLLAGGEGAGRSRI